MIKNVKKISIIGGSGTGKTTLAKMLAERLNITYLDTGAMYRGVGYYAKKVGVKHGDSGRL